MKLAIDASRNRSGGAIRHLVEILKNIDPEASHITEVHLWSYKTLLDKIDDKDWLIKHRPNALEKGVVFQLFWQRYILPREFKANNCDIILNTDAGTIARIVPSVTMSRDMLSYEAGELERYPLGKARLRLILLKYWQNSSLRNATGAVFLTQYASDIIQRSSGRLNNFRIINHGVSEAFRRKPRNKVGQNTFEIVYVSNVDLYKHQWNVVKACLLLRQAGFELKLHLVGSIEGPGKQMLLDTVTECDPNSEFVIISNHVNAEFLPQILSNADMFVFASSCENMPNSLVEGMASGLPIACSERGPMPEVLGDAGTYFDPENILSIVDALRHLITSEDVRNDLSKKAYKRALNFSWEKCASETIAYLREVFEMSTVGKDNQ